MSKPGRASRRTTRPSPSNSADIVGIGASAGGLEAFTELVRNLPVNAGLAYVLVQHLDPTHRSLLSELLGRSASLPVREIEDNLPVEPNRIYVIPPNTDLSVVGGVLKLTPRQRKAGPARSIDHFLKSLATDLGPRAIGVILSGAGSDGARGLKAIKDAGGITFAQDETSSKYDSMPRSAIATGGVDFVLPPADIAAEIGRIVDKPARTRRRAAANARQRTGQLHRSPRRSAPVTDEVDGDAPANVRGTDADLARIFVLLRGRTGVDFSHYRINTILRRLSRRLTLQRVPDLAAYHLLLRENPAEIDALYQSLLINVTEFFRNPAVFKSLAKDVFPRLVQEREEGATLRFWVAGCATGEEAYSLAIAFTEFAEKHRLRVPLQVFATDLNATVVEQARAGRYSRSQVAGVSEARLQRFFTSDGQGYRVQKSIRDQVIFAQQNLLNDPPFTRVDLISCRNLLIYIEPSLQRRILPVFHYALRPHGCLVLGLSESIGSASALFAPWDKTNKIFQKKTAPNRVGSERVPVLASPRPPPPAPRRRDAEPAGDPHREADRVMLEKYAPAAAVVNEEGDVIHLRGKVQPFLELPGGRATLNVVKLARNELSLTVQKALHRARTENRTVREKAVSFQNPRHLVQIEVVPLQGLPTRSFLMVFEKIAAPKDDTAATAGPGAAKSRARRADHRLVTELRRELTETRSHLDSLREQHETAVEELQASNEEVQSSNEELQSLNEELETSNEELESANEELTTLNEELGTRNTELRESEQRLREQAELVEMAPLLARSPKDRIVFWNRGAERLYGFTREEAMGQISHLFLGAQYPVPLEKLQQHLLAHGHWEGEIRHRRKDGTLLHIATQWVANYDEQHKLRAILEVCSDITARKAAQESLRQAQELNQRILTSSSDAILVLDLGGRLRFVNAGAHRAHEQGQLPAELDSHWSSLWPAESRAALDDAFRSALSGEVTRVQAAAGTCWWEVVVQPINDATGRTEQVLALCRDFTERKQAELSALEEARLAALRAEIAFEVARGGELAPILQQIAHVLLHHTEAVHVRIWLLDASASLLRLFASAGLYAQLNQQQAHIMVGEGRIGSIAASKRPHVTHQIAADPEICEPDWARREDLTSFAGYPLLFEARVLGVLAVLSRERLDARVLRELSLSADAVALLVQRKQGEDERGRLLQQAMDARNEAIAAMRAKDDFLATLSHELRTPLNPVLLLASDGAENPDLPPPVRSTFETIRNNVLLEARLIDDLLDLTRIAHGKLVLDLKPTDVNQTVEAALRIVSANAGAGRVVFVRRLEAPRATVIGDPVRLQQVFWNVLNNAVKFTPHGGTVTVETLCPTEDRIRVCIADTGIGMSESDLAQIFGAFSQVGRNYGGLGLGLTISRQLLEKHHGSIRAMSDGPGKGSRFEIELPLAALTQPDGTESRVDRVAPPLPVLPRAPASERPESAGVKRRLLLVEDHASTRQTLQTLLSRRNFEVTTASSLADARLRWDQGPFDLVISDLGLPDGNGYQLLEEFRAHQPHVPAIALSGYGTEEDRARSRSAGFRNHLTKPVSIDALDQAIADMTAPAG